MNESNLCGHHLQEVAGGEVVDQRFWDGALTAEVSYPFP